MLINLWVSPERGAPPESKKRMRPPKIARTFLNTRKFHRSISKPLAPNQLPLIADIRRAYAKSNSFLAMPPFSSTWNVKYVLITKLVFRQDVIQKHARSVCACKRANALEREMRTCQDSLTFFRTPSRTRSRIAGTAAITVGLKTVASPLVPLLILFDVSVRVNGLPYPIALPTPATKFCNIDNEVKHVYSCVYEFTWGYEKPCGYSGYVNHQLNKSPIPLPRFQGYEPMAGKPDKHHCLQGQEQLSWQKKLRLGHYHESSSHPV